MYLRACAGPERDQASQPMVDALCASTVRARLSTNSVDMSVHVRRFGAWVLARRRTHKFSASAALRWCLMAYDRFGVRSTTFAALFLPVLDQDFASNVNS